MSASTKPKQTSRWGSLLQGAVANLESRLDTILAEEGASKKAAEDARPGTPEQPRGGSTTTRAIDTRPDRLTVNGTRQTTEERPSSRSRPLARLSEPAEGKERSSFESSAPDIVPRISIDSTPVKEQTDETEHDGIGQEGHFARTLSSTNISATDISSRPSVESNRSGVSHDISAPARTSLDRANDNNHDTPLSNAEYQARIAHMQVDYETAELQRQEEMHTYLERIDALQSKLQYLADEAAESARSAASQASSDSLEKKLAAKNEQIALLMAEGQKLSKTEVNLSTTIRKLRTKTAEDSKSLADVKRKLASAERSATEAAEKISRLETTHRDALTKVSRLSRIEREVEDLRTIREAQDSTIETLEKQLQNANARAEDDQKLANAQALEAERRLTRSLRDDAANLNIEKRLSDEKSRALLRAANEELQRERERGSALEVGLRNEILILEGKSEVLRSRTEEVSSTVTGDSQAKLMRQIETLQSQYSEANENWQGIEASLQARLTTLEIEKDEAARQESEARRKTRDVGSASRRLQEQLDAEKSRCSILEYEMAERQAHAEKLQSRVIEFGKSLQDAKQAYERDRQNWEANLATRVEEERQKWRQETAHGPPSAVPQLDSPSSYRKPFGLEMPNLPARRNISRNFSSTEVNMPILERHFSGSRRSSVRPGRSPDIQTTNGFESGRSTPHIPFSSVHETPSIETADEDDPFENGSSPHQTVNDMISGSTAAAGPSVQLVERITAKTRHLESEKAALKDELTRLSAQRDEARKEVVFMMREVEQKRAVDANVQKLEQDMAGMSKRYQTTLEMLGERSERVEELEADVADLKKIYRELVDSTMK